MATCREAWALVDRKTSLSARVAALRGSVTQQRAARALRQQQVAAARKELWERRQAHERRLAEWTASRRRLDARRFRVSRQQFLSEPRQHSATVGAFHELQELLAVSRAMQMERKRRCQELVSIFPLRWLEGDGSGARSVCLGPAHELLPSGEISEEQQTHLEAALGFLVPLAAALGIYLDVDLPFPCTVGLGLAESRVLSPFESSPTRPRSRASDAPWVRPCVLHPLTGRWRFFSIYDGVCTSEFAVALRLSDENLRVLCARVGAAAPPALTTPQLVDRCLDAAIFGSPPPEAKAPRARSPTPETCEDVDRGLRRELFHGRDVCSFEDGEWTVLEPGERLRAPALSDPCSPAPATASRPNRPRTSTF